MPTDLSSSVAAFAAVVSVIVSILAYNAARKASELDQKIQNSLLRFKEDLVAGKAFADDRITDLRLKGVDNYLGALDHRTTRNTDHITMLFSALLSCGVDLTRVKKRISQEEQWNPQQPGS